VAVIEIAGLRKTYRRLRHAPERAVDGLDLVVEEGGVFGFLGPNGSGKTTTIRLLLGLVHADAGDMRVLGKPVPGGLPDAIGEIGALVETPVFFSTLSARVNLQLLAEIAGLGNQRVDEVLDLVGLSDRARDNVKGYSLGMRQRLGIAAALLKDPRLLILDEPSNGLDPAGIREIRELVRTLGASGKTVFLSSHLLAEVQQVCDHMAILSHGRCIVTGRASDVLSARTTGEVRVRLADLSAGTTVLTAAGLNVTTTDDALTVTGAVDPADITKLLAANSLYVSELTPVKADLETVFLDLTADA
jgi:ABC-2 type transport system ATP-binding protein